MYHIGSSSIDAIGYEPWAQELHVRFQGSSDRTYVYHDVTFESYESLLVADSIGRFVNQEIKPQHRVSKLGEAA